MTEISSANNDHYRRWIDLATARGIKKHGEFILMGEKLIEEFLKNPHLKIKAEIIHEGLDPQAPSGTQLYKIAKSLFKEVDVIGTHYNLLVLEAPSIPLLDEGVSPQGLELIAPLGDPSNLGALARSALAFGVSKLILTEESCHPFHPKALKSSAGALLKLPTYKTKSFADFLKSQKDLFALDMKGEDVGNFDWPRDLRLAVGEEGPGLSGLKGLKRLSVPSHNVESLNATVAASIAFYTYASRHQKM